MSEQKNIGLYDEDERTLLPEEERPEGCDACLHETAPLKSYAMNRNAPVFTEKKWLCYLCASTFAGVAFEYPEQYPDRKTMYSINYVGNEILLAIKAQREAV